jgi:hypothetical protein
LFLTLACLALVLGLSTTPAYSQAATGTLTGTITDQQGATIPAAEVRVVEPTTSSTRTVVTNDVGRYTALADGDLFDMEYWVLEQAKLGKAKEPVLAGQVALVTGAVGAIGFGICKQLVAAGAHVVLTDIDQARLDAAVRELDPRSKGLAAGVPMDVTSEASVAAGFAQAARLYGGVDVIVLNAGVAHVSKIEETDPQAFKSGAGIGTLIERQLEILNFKIFKFKFKIWDLRTFNG